MKRDIVKIKNKADIRESGIELLRILLMLGVMTIHFNKPGVAITSLSGSAFHFMNITESIVICAVDGFMLISGYYMCRSEKRKLVKPLMLLTELILMKLIWHIFSTVVHKEAFTAGGILHALLPDRYFIVLYIVVYILSVYVNPMLRDLSSTGWRRLMITLILLFSIWPTIFDFLGDYEGAVITQISTIGLYGSGKGFTVITFLMMYIIGAYIRLNSIDEKYTNIPALIAVLAACMFIISVSTYINKSIMLGHGMDITDSCTALQYNNPVVILEAIVVFLIFRNIHFKSRFINHIAQAAFTCYITHYFFRGALYDRIGDAIGKGLPFFIGYWLFTIAVLYIMGYIVHIVYNALSKPVFNKLDAFFEKRNLTLDLKR